MNSFSTPARQALNRSSPHHLPTSDLAMDICTSRFGTIRFSSADVICFPGGLAGLEDFRSWVLLMQRPGDSVAWFQSTQDAELALPVIDPRSFVPDYKVRLDASDWNPLGATQGVRPQILVTVAPHDSVLTANLLAPLAINPSRRLGRQVINIGNWPVDYVVLDMASIRKIA